MKPQRLLLACVLGLGLALALLWLLDPTRSAADTSAVPYYVSQPCGAPVPDPCYTSIQAAVNAASSGNTIRVVQGTYHEAVVISKSLTLEGGWSKASPDTRDWNVYTTTVDAQRAGPVIWVNKPVTVTIEGFIITGGDATSTGLGWGGGINVDPSFPSGGMTTIRHNVITNNVACSSCDSIGGQGGGIHVYDSSIVVESNTIISNAGRTGGSGGGKGGGVCVGYMAGAVLTGNLIVSNTAVFSPTGTWSGQGGGVYINSQSVMLHDNEIRSNVAAVTGTGQGGGIYAAGSSLYENRILSNTASISGTGEGGGVYAKWVQDVDDNLVQGNWASRSGDGTGGGIYAIQLQNADRNTIADNRAKRGGGLYLGSYSHTHLRDNWIARNWATGLVAGTYDGGGGISSADDRAEIVSNDIISNGAYAGGGILVTAGDEYLVQDNRIQGNVADAGGGIYVYSATGSIVQNQIVGNGAVWWGGGMYLFGKASPVMDSNIVMSNAAGGALGFAGGGLVLNPESGTRITLTNHIIAGNTIVTGTASGVHCVSGSCALIHCTIVDNKLGSGRGEGVRIGAMGGANVLWNSIIVGHSTGVVISGGVTALLDYNNYFDNTTHVSGGITGTHSDTRDPQFVDRAAGDYHLAETSPLINLGDSSLSAPRDFEGDPRPIGPRPDMGADEYVRARIYLPIVLRNWSSGGPGLSKGH